MYDYFNFIWLKYLNENKVVVYILRGRIFAWIVLFKLFYFYYSLFWVKNRIVIFELQ